ncbi:hypothetical protein M406DRAFT_348012 [Cryphonectria parasitica EP155]|uniref:UspA domain-containing protein n=1 Tax=Cryphonectria parasitica (strain ATCC 38755 / EP155) TaxID=660469 RepID=A0A9P4XVL0_CRYP1|nr:uncharacterized protein M406DRAFT_348012 [Cryphonectria parasitica EP155]KAF3761803.1 hypothetical protein M406DRAFT_348012 [Cryphonectria parasitica EP155]
MSMEAALEEERLEVEQLVAARNAAPRPHSALSNARSSSPYTPRSPVRSMLDIGKQAAPVRSMLDMDSPPPSASATKAVFSTPSSPVLMSNQLAKASNTTHPRHMSDVSGQSVSFGPRSTASRDPTSQFKFGDIVTSQGQVLPKRVYQGNKKDVQSQSSMSHIVRGGDVPTIPLPGDRGRHSVAGPSMRVGSKSRSPHSRLGARSTSPGNPLIHGRTMSPAGRALLQEAYPGVDMNNAYRKLSDLNRLRAGGLLANSVGRKRSDDQPGGGRLVKDFLSPDGDEMLDDSSDEQGYSSQEEGQRGRKAARDSDKPAQTPEARQIKSLLAAAEEERINVTKQAPKYQYRSLFDDPEITVTTPSGEVSKESKSKKVHPATNFDEGPPSGARTPMDSDDEADLVDIKRAQKLSFSQTAIMNTPNAARAVRIIYRGDYGQVSQAAKADGRDLRKYIVATDLSDESTHALEWAVGTVMRDGDTMICLYCVDEEIGIAPRDGSQVPDERKAMREQGTALNTITASKAPVTPGGSSIELQKSSLGHNSESSLSPARSKAEVERHMAVQDITERVKKYLRKTRLQVRVIVEVLHCKNPKHQILEIIDVVSPTLVILGSRGQSALKGVILGSFSNYLVTKSSVPVMVARKRLRKQSKYKKMALTQVNNINNPTARSLANAKVD